MENKFKDI
jgi:hypothetical protein